MSNIKVSLTKVRLNKSGYDSCGYYWGGMVKPFGTMSIMTKMDS